VPLKRDQPRIAYIGAAKIEFLGTMVLSGLKGLPEQHWHRSEIVKGSIGAAVFVEQCGLMLQREYSCYWSAILGRSVNRKTFSKTFFQVSKPCHGLRRQAQTAPRQHKQTVKLG